MKPALYYAIRTFALYLYVVAVTSEKRNGTRWFGRDCRHNEATHGRSSDLRGRFDTQEAAEAMRARIADVAKSFNEVRQRVSEYASKIGRFEGEAIDRLLKGEEPGPVPVVSVVTKQWIATHNAEWVASGHRRSLGSHGNSGQLGGACARAAEDVNPMAGGFIVVMPDKTKERI